MTPTSSLTSAHLFTLLREKRAQELGPGCRWVSTLRLGASRYRGAIIAPENSLRGQFLLPLQPPEASRPTQASRSCLAAPSSLVTPVFSTGKSAWMPLFVQVNTRSASICKSSLRFPSSKRASLHLGCHPRWLVSTPSIQPFSLPRAISSTSEGLGLWRHLHRPRPQ